MLPGSRMGTGVATYLSALVIVLASLLVGRAVLLLLGRRQASFLEGAVGIATLVLVCTISIRLPGEETASLLASGVLVIGSLVFLLVRRESILGPAVGIALPVALLAGLLASVPFIASGQIGIPGVGLNNDMAMHLVDTEYLLDNSRPEPVAIINGYPMGPHSLVATVVSLLGTEPLPGWLGLLVAGPVLIGITSLAVLRELPAGRRILAAALVSVAYLTASVFGIAGFKELLAGTFLIAFALGLREIERSDDGRVAILIGLALIAAAMVPVYSFPGLGWLGITGGLWVLAHLVHARIEDGPGGASALVRRSLPIAGPAIGVLVLVGLTQLPKAIDFAQSGAVGNVAGTDSKLRYAVSPFETLGIWPSGNWLLSTTDLSSAWIFAVIGMAGLAFGLVWWMQKRDFGVPAAVVSGIAIYAYLRWVRDGGLYIQAKAVVVPASLVMLLVLFALFTPGGGRLKRGFAVVFVALAAYSSFLALRDVVVAPDHRFDELSEFRDEIAGDRVLSLTSDRFADYGLRTAEVASPAFNAEIRVPSNGGKAPEAADRLRHRANRGPEPVPLRRHHQRRLSEPRAPELDGERLDRFLPALATQREHAADRNTRRGGPARPHLPLRESQVRPLPQPRRRGIHMAAAGDRQAPLLGARQPARAGGGGEPGDRAPARGMAALHPIRQPGIRDRGAGARPRRRAAGGRRGRNPLPPRSGPLLAGGRDRRGRNCDADRPGR